MRDELEQESAPSAAASAGREAAAGVGPILLLLPILTFGLAYLWMNWHEARVLVPPADPPPQLSTDSIPGWAASRTSEEGLEFEARLTGLHAQQAQQRFDASTLARRYGLVSGEPFRLTLGWRLPPGDDSHEAAREMLDNQALRALRIVESSGESSGEGGLSPLELPGQRPNAGALDPVSVLLGPPREGLHLGEEVSLVFWGPRPSGELILRGLPQGELHLAQTDLARKEVVKALARLDPRLLGSEGDGEQER